ncbi:6-phosphogluconate dehydrogenase, decarboxylating [Portunus trituberculatus]|uniref:phosphogluconate dehydrogenase (NADP(+)-dependent, decarboxylating) n=1 Tax=Portunus trituberculatus TaxID=210409 RepID=A0A5B7G6C5_PORTR|nr:6-phosphogluconate dehydrogenase, decarboxylating [Portunus trituberculatus]
MGQNLILNMDDHGWVVCAFNRTTEKVDSFLAKEAKGTKVVGAHSLPEMVAKLKKPRRVMLLVKGESGICAKSGDEPCCDWVGEDGAGHYVKMVHNGIEYGDMQLICEAYHLMKDALGMSCDEMREVSHHPTPTGEALVEKIRDAAGQKGTGKWTAISGLDFGTPTTLIAESVFARCLSALKVIYFSLLLYFLCLRRKLDKSNINNQTKKDH